MNDQEIRILTLRFIDADTATRFVSLAKRWGYNPARSWEGDWQIIRTTFQNKAERSRLMSAWAKESLITV